MVLRAKGCEFEPTEFHLVSSDDFLSLTEEPEKHVEISRDFKEKVVEPILKVQCDPPVRTS